MDDELDEVILGPLVDELDQLLPLEVSIAGNRGLNRFTARLIGRFLRELKERQPTQLAAILTQRKARGVL